MSDRDYLYDHVCAHGSMARFCRVCDLEDEARRLRDGIAEHDRRNTADGGGRARCTPVMGELLDDLPTRKDTA